jgi:zinc and cadmium transporter
VTLVLASFASVIAVSLVSLVGLLALSMSEARLRRLATFFVSFAVGALLGDAFIHLIPETFATAGSDAGKLSRSLLIIGGILLFFVIEKLLLHRHGLLHSQYHADRAG